MITLPSPEQRDRASLTVAGGGICLGVLGLIAHLGWALWFVPLVAGLGALAFRMAGRHHPTLADDIREALPARRAPKVSVRPLPGGALVKLTPSPALTDAQLRSVLAGPVAAHGYQIAGIRHDWDRSVRVTFVELSPC